MSVKVSGIRSAQSALSDAIRDVNVESEEMISVILQSISANTASYVPVDTSALINSEYRQTQMTATGPRGEIGYGASYAGYVHEGPQKNWQKPGASNQFLALGVRDFIRDDLSRIIQVYNP